MSPKGATDTHNGKDDEQKLRTYRDAVVIVTGAASGIGRALVEELVANGAGVIILIDRQISVAEELAEGLRGNKGIMAEAHEVDVRNFAALKKVVEHTKEKYGRIDFMFNNAAICVAGPLERNLVSDFDTVLDVNIHGTSNGVLAVYPIMIEQRYGHIVNTASVAGLIPRGNKLSYVVSKHAVVGLSTSLRIEAAIHGVQVSVLCPGFVNTPILDMGLYGKNLTDLPPDLWQDRMKPIDPGFFAKKALRLVKKNKPIIVIPFKFKPILLLYRLFPSTTISLLTKMHKR